MKLTFFLHNNSSSLNRKDLIEFLQVIQNESHDLKHKIHLIIDSSIGKKYIESLTNKNPNLSYKLVKISNSDDAVSFLHKNKNLCIGDYLCLLNGNFTLEKNSLASIISIIEKNQSDFFLFNFYNLQQPTDEIKRNRDDKQKKPKTKVSTLATSADIIGYKKMEDLFFDFDFLTRTVKFPFCFKTSTLTKAIAPTPKTKTISLITTKLLLFSIFSKKEACLISTPFFTLNETKAEKPHLRKRLYNTYTLIESLTYLNENHDQDYDKVIHANKIFFDGKNQAITIQTLISHIADEIISLNIEYFSSYNFLGSYKLTNKLTQLHDSFIYLIKHSNSKDLLYKSLAQFLISITTRIEKTLPLYNIRINIDSLRLWHESIQHNIENENPNLSYKSISSGQAILLSKGPRVFTPLHNNSTDAYPEHRLDNHQVPLTILVPTYNRGVILQELLKRFIKLGINEMKEVEIFVAINACTDQTVNICRNFAQAMPNLRTQYFSEFSHSAEENINRSLPYCKGKYTYILGDDDLLLLYPFLFLLAKIKTTDDPVLVFNSTAESILPPKELDGQNLEGVHPFSGVTNKSQYQDLLKTYGLTSTMAFISRYVIRNDLVLDMSKHIKVSRIYSHIFGFFEMFGDNHITTINIPIVARGDSQVEERFANTAKKTNTPFFHPWTTGLLQHIRALTEKKEVQPNWLFQIVEYPSQDFSYMQWQEIMAQALKQCILFLQTQQDYQKPTMQFIELIHSFDPSSLFDSDKVLLNNLIIAYQRVCIKTMVKGKMTKGEIEQEIALLHQAIGSINNKSSRLTKKLNAYLDNIFGLNISTKITTKLIPKLRKLRKR